MPIGVKAKRSKKEQRAAKENQSAQFVGSQDIPQINVDGTRSKIDGILKDLFSSSKEVQVLSTRRKFTIFINTLKISLFKRYHQINSEGF